MDQQTTPISATQTQATVAVRENSALKTSLIYAGCIVSMFALAHVFLHANGIPEKRLASLSEEMQTAQYDWVLTGNSVVDYGIDREQMERESQKSVWKFSLGGTKLPWWYLATKNVVARLPHAPQVLVLFFRDREASDIVYNLYGDNTTQLIAISESHEPVLEERVYRPNLGNAQFYLFKYLPIYRSSQEIKSLVYPAVRTIVAAVTGTPEGQLSKMLGKHLSGTQLDMQVHQKWVTALDSGKYGITEVPTEIENSLLPEIVRITKESGIQLVMVRVKKNAYTETVESKATKEYMVKLRAYLSENDVPLLDYAESPAIKKEHFPNRVTDHLNPQGAKVFTSLLTRDLLEILANDDL